jgi:membrane-associated progesterone receptor component
MAHGDPDLSWLAGEVLQKPVNLLLLVVLVVLLVISVYYLYSWLRSGDDADRSPNSSARNAPLPKLRKQDWTLEQLKPYNGVENPRILIAVHFKVFDVTARGKDFYGPGGPYQCFAGRDASRALARMSLQESDIPEEYDELSDLTDSHLESLKEWELQFMERYTFVGRLLGTDERPTDYSESEMDGQ